MKRSKYIFMLLMVCGFLTRAQENFVLTAIDKDNTSQIKVKWYSKAFLYPEGVNVYRMQKGGEWQKLNPMPIKKGSQKLSAEDYKKDKELKSYVEMIDGMANLQGVALLACYLQSFKSESFSRYVGICYVDNDVLGGQEVRYKVCSLQNGVETELGISEYIAAGKPNETNPPENIAIKVGNKNTLLRWKTEPLRYYGVNIYRSQDSTKLAAGLITKDPIVISKTKNAAGKEEYPEWFYQDIKLKQDSVYYYAFASVDFFGRVSVLSKTYIAQIKDMDSPESPVISSCRVEDKKIVLRWKKGEFENDFAGYAVYRAEKKDTLYLKLTPGLLSKDDTVFVDKPANAMTYRYIVAAVDKVGNEGISLEAPVEIIDEEAPAVPKGLIIKADTGKIHLRWMANTEPDLMGYLVYQAINKDVKESNYVLITPKPLVKPEFFQELPKNAKNKFLYKVLAVDSSYNKSTLSAFASTTLPDVVAPQAPFIKTCELNDKKQVQIEFFKNTELDLKGYELYRVRLEENENITEKVNIKTIDRTSYRYIDRGLDATGIMKYYLLAVDSAGNVSEPSNVATINIKPETEVKKYEIQKLKYKLDGKGKKCKLSWEINDKPEDLFYMVYVRKADGEEFEAISGKLEQAKYTCSMNEGVSVLQVRAYTSKGLVARSEIITIEIK